MCCTTCEELQCNAVKQVINHEGGTKNQATEEEILRDDVIAQLEAQFVEF